MSPRHALGAVLALIGVAFFVAGTIGLLRFPDVFTRLHALTKADNLGLGFISLGLMVSADDPGAALELGVIWILALIASATGAQLIATHALSEREGERDDEPLAR